MSLRSTLWNTEEFYANGLEEGRALASTKDKYIRFLIDTSLVQWAGATEKDIVEEMVRLHRVRLAAVPDLSVYPDLDGCREALEAGDRGRMEGAGITHEELAILRNYFWFAQSCCRSGKGMIERGCTGVFIADSPEGPLAGANHDDWIDRAPVEPPPATITNPNGIGTLGASCGIYLDEEPPECFPAPVHYMVDKVCTSVDEALELYTHYNYFWGPQNAIVFDRTGASAVIEKSSCRYGIRRGDDYAYTTAMHMETPEMKGYLRERRDAYLADSGIGIDCPDEMYWQGCEARHHNLARLMAEAAANPSADAVRAVIQNHARYPASLCVHGERDHPVMERGNYTLRSTIWHIAKNTATFWRIKEDGKPACQNEPEYISAE